MHVGFIGLGVMGRPMALHLLRAGYPLGVWARRPEACRPLVDAGAHPFQTAAELARNSDVLFTMVTTGADVEGVLFGETGLVAGFVRGAVWVDMSTIAPEDARRLAKILAGHGVDTLDAPVSGGEQGAVAATLAIMVGGKAPVVERVWPLFETMGRTIIHVGGNGAGQVAKMCNQMVMVGAIQALAEALHLSRAAGVDPAKVRRAMGGGSGASRVLDVMGRRMVDGDFIAGVEARLHHKDFSIVTGEAYRLALAMPVSAQVAQQLGVLMAAGWGRADTAALLRVLEWADRSGDTSADF